MAACGEYSRRGRGLAYDDSPGAARAPGESSVSGWWAWAAQYQLWACQKLQAAFGLP